MSWKIRLLRCHLLPVRPQRIAAFTASIIARMISAGCCCSGAADIHRFFTSASMVLRPAQHVMSLSPYFGLSAPAHKAALLDMDDRQHSSLNWSKRRNEAQPVVMAMTAFKLQPHSPSFARKARTGSLSICRAVMPLRPMRGSQRPIMC